MQAPMKVPCAAVVTVDVAPDQPGSEGKSQDFELRPLPRMKVTPTYMTVSGGRYV